MFRFLPAGLVVLLSATHATSALAQGPSAIYSTPEVPSAAALRPLNLTVAWYRYVPTLGRRDTLLSIQLAGPDMLVQTRSGLVVRLDAETGAVHWRARVGTAYEAYRALSYNHRSVFVVNSNYLYALDRNDGSVQWRFRLPAGISAAPVVGELTLYLSSSTGLLYSYSLPVTEALSARETGDTGGTYSTLTEVHGTGRAGAIGPQPRLFWDAHTNLRLEHPPVQNPESVLCVSPSGRAVAYAKVPHEGSYGTTELYRFQAEGAITAAPGSFGDEAYLGSQDANVYALHITSGRLLWRYTAGTAITRRPVALENDVYVTSERDGLIRLDRPTGTPLWRIPDGRTFSEGNRQADRFLAANNKFVYATDPSGRLLILDRKRGTLLSRFDTRDFRFPVPNEVTDRLYLAANNGLIVCLRDRDQTTPIRHRRSEEAVSEPPRKKLEAVVKEPGRKPESLRTVVAELSKKYDLKIVVVERAFKEAGVDAVFDKQVQIPKLEGRTLGELLQRVFSQVNGTYELAVDTVVVIPGKPAAK
jgi:outer membrane protein assembly factor BamB